jgi:hypothetical protein
MQNSVKKSSFLPDRKSFILLNSSIFSFPMILMNVENSQ